MNTGGALLERARRDPLAKEWPLVGRATQLERISTLLRDGGRAVVVAGQAGVGKTRLATESLNLAAGMGFACAHITGTQAAAALPFGAYASLLPDLGPGEHRSDLLRHVARAVAQRGDGRRMALVVDDAHLLDQASAALTHQLAVAEDSFVLATVRAAEPASDAVVALWKDGVAPRVELPPLGRTDIEALLARVLGNPVSAATAQLLFERSGGNVLFLKELVLAASQAGVLHLDGGLWSLRGWIPASARLAELIEARLVGVDHAEREILEVLALGEPLGVDLLRDGAQRLHGLERRGLVSVAPHDRRLSVRLAHPLYGEVLRARLSPLRARSLSRSLADRVEATGANRSEDLLRVATWRLTGGGEVDPERMLAAATMALRHHDAPLAERLARAAAQAGAGFHAALLEADAVGLQGRVLEAEAELLALAARATTDEERGLVAVARIDNLHYGMGRGQEALRLGEQAEASLRDPRWRREVAAHKAMVLGHIGGPRAALEAAAPLRRDGEGRSYVLASYVTAMACVRMGEVEAAVEAATHGRAAHVAMSGTALRWPPEVASTLVCEALVHAGRLAEAEAVARAAYDWALGDRSTETQALCAWHVAGVALARGHAGHAVHYGREASTLLRQVARWPFLAYALASLAAALALSGDVAEASRTLTELDAMDIPPHDIRAVDILRARAWTAVAAGDLLRGRRLLEDGLAVGFETGDRAGRLSALHDLARLGWAREMADPVERVALEMEGELPPARVLHVRSLTTDDSAALERASTAFEALGADLLGAEAAADAAVAWRRAGDPRRAAAAGRRAQLLAARCQGARTPALTGLAVRVALTARELEIARLAGAGVPNKEIARRLFLSLHTVQNKLHSAYEKLGVQGRSGLAQALEGY